MPCPLGPLWQSLKHENRWLHKRQPTPSTHTFTHYTHPHTFDYTIWRWDKLQQTPTAHKFKYMYIRAVSLFHSFSLPLSFSVPLTPTMSAMPRFIFLAESMIGRGAQKRSSLSAVTHASPRMHINFICLTLSSAPLKCHQISCSSKQLTHSAEMKATSRSGLQSTPRGVSSDRLSSKGMWLGAQFEPMQAESQKVILFRLHKESCDIQTSNRTRSKNFQKLFSFLKLALYVCIVTVPKVFSAVGWYGSPAEKKNSQKPANIIIINISDS